jgi:hypothetical protein
MKYGKYWYCDGKSTICGFQTPKCIRTKYNTKDNEGLRGFWAIFSRITWFLTIDLIKIENSKKLIKKIIVAGLRVIKEGVKDLVA